MPPTSSKPIRYSPFTKVLGLNFLRRENGESHCALEVSEKLLNSGNIVHGGAISTMADVGMGAALRSCVDDSDRIATIEIKVSYFVAVKSGVLTCKSKVVHKSRKLAGVESEITHGGRVVAKATGTFYISKRSKATAN